MISGLPPASLSSVRARTRRPSNVTCPSTLFSEPGMGMLAGAAFASEAPAKMKIAAKHPLLQNNDVMSWPHAFSPPYSLTWMPKFPLRHQSGLP
jgi:hypothetical protein